MRTPSHSCTLARRRSWIAAVVCVIGLLIQAKAAEAANPLGIAFKDTANVSLYGQPTGMVIAGRCNRNDPAFDQARRNGAEVLLYVSATARPDARVCALDNELYLNDPTRVPLWPYPSEGQRVSYPKTHMTDMRPGSPWILHVVDYVEQLMREGKVDGVFLDAMGARSWDKLADWSNWPQAERDVWTDGNIDLVRRLDERRRAIDPKFIIVTNGYWDRGDARGLDGERYVDGIMLEHPKAGSSWHLKQASKPFSDLGHRRVLVVATDHEAAQEWAKAAGVTHVSDQAGGARQYAHPTEPPIAFEPLHDRAAAAAE
ncbi:hypothetical protein [Steroidobacter sp.]|uniref:hypothetical protein n=1 Tax=Steroidobacter sp. TaxID=1978227 RepID=UPI001A614695|nr:hypothetical protein [Steroidobacter sp.]MBL8270185.1 hypothetical protein [Steroidobacter sp.]